MKEIQAQDAGILMSFRQPGCHHSRATAWRLAPGAAQDLGAHANSDRERRQREVRNPPCRGPHARAHERVARRGGRTL